jgi:G3E family GTPase
VEFADVIVLNKVDRVDPSALPTLRALVQKLNPMARIVTTTYSKVSPQVR